jgi:ribosomal protein S12 methylthiotransferase
MVSLGCSKNTYDSEVLMGQLKVNKVRLLTDSETGPVDTVIINTCGFINDAKEESIETILEYIESRKKGYVKNIFVMGCLVERYREALLKEIPEIDEVFGVDEMAAIVRKLGSEYRQELVGERVLLTPPHFAYLKIAEGCNRNCSFCAIPKIRGSHKSRTIIDIVEEAKILADKGVKELLLISQDPTYYGIDLYEEQMLPRLLEKLSDLGRFDWIRLHYLHPAMFTDRLLDVIAERENICKYIDIPLQHISDRILTSMHRGFDSKSTYRLLEKIRKRLPSAAIRSTFIVGYPGETENEFEELLDFISTVRFDRAGVFQYSHEEDTDAYHLKDNVPVKVKSAREERLMETQQEISHELNEAKVGSTYKVLIDYHEDGGYYSGRTEYDSPEVDNEVIIRDENIKIKEGTFQNVQIISTNEYDLIGKILN